MHWLGLRQDGIEPDHTQIEVTSFFQIPSFHLVGLPGQEVLESRERVRAAIESSGFDFPKRRVIANLAPSGVKKGGTYLDLPIALGILSAHLSTSPLPKNHHFALGELGLDGSIKRTGYLLRAWSAAWRAGVQTIFCSAHEREDEASAREILKKSEAYPGPLPEIRAFSTLKEAWECFQNPASYPTLELKSLEQKPSNEELFHFAEIENLLPLPPLYERTLLATLIGGHSFLWLGAKGAGKTQLFQWARALQPSTDPRTALENAWIEGLCPLEGNRPLERNQKQFLKNIAREVNPQIRPAGLLGSIRGSGDLKVGELALAHGGILFADEFLEWPRDSRECLRAPLEVGKIKLTRANGTVEIPARFQLLANGNLCPCGDWGGDENRCSCKETVRNLYLQRLSGPLLDRMDGVLKVHRLNTPSGSFSPEELLGAVKMRKEKIRLARERARSRYGGISSTLSFQDLESLEIPKQFSFSSLRSRHRTARMALSLALLDGQVKPSSSHWSEAKNLRPEFLGLFSRKAA